MKPVCAREALAHVGNVAAPGGTQRDLDFELRVEQMFVDQRAAHPRRIRLHQLLKRREFSSRIVQRPAKVCFAGVDLILKTDRMAKLVDRIDFTADAIARPPRARALSRDRGYPRDASDQEPSAAVDAGAPCARQRDQAAGVAIVQVACGRLKLLDRKRCRRVVIYREIDIGIFARGATRARAAERHRP